MRSVWSQCAAVTLVGLLLGYALSRIGFSSWDEVHAMFVFSRHRLLLTFGAAFAILVVAWQIVARTSTPRWSRRRIHKGTLAGGILFGIGWALSGACPSIAFVQIGEGQLGGAWVVLGIFAGNFTYAKVHERWFRWSLGSCLDD